MNKYIHFRNFCLFLSVMVFICASSSLRAQTDTLAYPEQFLFPDFAKGKVVMKGGKGFDMILNYNIISEKIILIQDRKIRDLANPGSVDTIYLLNRKFIPAGKVFYELLAEKPFLLFVQHTSKVTVPPKMDSYGKIPETASTSANKLLFLGTQSDLSSDQKFIINKEEVYWVHVDNSMQSFKDAMQLVKIFPRIKGEIRLYIRQKKLRFENPDDIQKLMIYCNNILK